MSLCVYRKWSHALHVRVDMLVRYRLKITFYENEIYHSKICSLRFKSVRKQRVCPGTDNIERLYAVAVAKGMNHIADIKIQSHFFTIQKLTELKPSHYLSIHISKKIYHYYRKWLFTLKNGFETILRRIFYIEGEMTQDLSETLILRVELFKNKNLVHKSVKRFFWLYMKMKWIKNCLFSFATLFRL